MSSTADPATGGHHESVGQPHDPDVEGPVAEAEAKAARISDSDKPMGTLGKRFNRRSPFLIGMAAAAGVAVTYGLVLALTAVADILILIGLAMFLAIGVEPLVSWLVRRRVPRWLAVLIVFLAVLGALAGFFAAVIPLIVEQASQIVANAPSYVQDPNSLIGRLNNRFHLQQAVESSFSGGSGLAGGVFGAGQAVFSVVVDVLVVIVLTVYFVADLPRIRATMYRLIPDSRRPRAILIGDEIFAKVGAYVLGNLLVSLITGLVTLAWLLIFGVPYAVLLALTVAILDLIPVIGSIIGGILISLVALTVSLPVCLATIGFFLLYKFIEDYLLIPKIIGSTVKVPALITVVAVLIGGALLGILGALVAIPIAAAGLLIAHEVLYPRLDQA